MALGAAFEGRGEPAYKPLYRGHPDFGRRELDGDTPRTTKPDSSLIRDIRATVSFHPDEGGGYYCRFADQPFDMTSWCRSGEFDIAAINSAANHLRLREAELVYVAAPIMDHWTSISVVVPGGKISLVKI